MLRFKLAVEKNIQMDDATLESPGRFRQRPCIGLLVFVGIEAVSADYAARSGMQGVPSKLWMPTTRTGLPQVLRAVPRIGRIGHGTRVFRMVALRQDEINYREFLAAMAPPQQEEVWSLDTLGLGE